MYIPRRIEKTLAKVLDRPEIIAVVGARQVGKTTLINHLFDSQSNKRINKVTFDNIQAKSLFTDDTESFIEVHIKPYDLVFIDEIQYVQDNGKILKYIHDTQKIKLIISGSSATELSIQSLKYLVGRVLTYTLYPLSFEEYIEAKKPQLLPLYQKGTYGQQIISQLNTLRQEYMIYGGYPAAVNTPSKEIKEKIIQSLYDTYLLREIKELLQLASSQKLIKLLKTLALQSGNIINYSSLAQQTGFSHETVKKYLKILEQTFIIQLIRPFYTNKKKELVKSPKVYFVDAGFRRACLGQFFMDNPGIANEEFAVTELLKEGLQPKFWHTKAKAEVDFVLEHQGNIIPIEIKTTLNTPKTTRSFQSFKEHYQPEHSFICSNELETSAKGVKFVPLVKLNTIIRLLK